MQKSHPKRRSTVQGETWQGSPKLSNLIIPLWLWDGGQNVVNGDYMIVIRLTYGYYAWRSG